MPTITDANVLSVDLVRAARRSEDVPQDVSDAELERSADRYVKFLMLARKHPGKKIAPTRDIDRMWHLHMLSPRRYVADCQRLLGYILDHDGGFGADPSERPLLLRTFEETARLWAEEYGEPYVQEPSTSAAINCQKNCSTQCASYCQGD